MCNQILSQATACVFTAYGITQRCVSVF